MLSSGSKSIVTIERYMTEFLFTAKAQRREEHFFRVFRVFRGLKVFFTVNDIKK